MLVCFYCVQIKQTKGVKKKKSWGKGVHGVMRCPRLYLRCAIGSEPVVLNSVGWHSLKALVGIERCSPSCFHCISYLE